METYFIQRGFIGDICEIILRSYNSKNGVENDICRMSPHGVLVPQPAIHKESVIRLIFYKHRLDRGAWKNIPKNVELIKEDPDEYLDRMEEFTSGYKILSILSGMGMALTKEIMEINKIDEYREIASFWDAVGSEMAIEHFCDRCNKVNGIYFNDVERALLSRVMEVNNNAPSSEYFKTELNGVIAVLVEKMNFNFENFYRLKRDVGSFDVICAMKTPEKKMKCRKNKR